MCVWLELLHEREVRVSQHTVCLWLIRVEGTARNDVIVSIEGRRGNRMQRASFELLGGALLLNGEEA